MIITLVLKTLMRKGQGPYDGSNWIKIIDHQWVGVESLINVCTAGYYMVFKKSASEKKSASLGNHGNVNT